MIISFDEKSKNVIGMMRTLRDSVQRAISAYEEENDTRVGSLESIDKETQKHLKLLDDSLKSLYVVTEEETEELTLESGSSWSDAQLLPLSNDGYDPIGIVGFRVKGFNVMWLNIYRILINEDGDSVEFNAMNMSSNGTYTGTILFHVLWKKNL